MLFVRRALVCAVFPGLFALGAFGVPREPTTTATLPASDAREWYRLLEREARSGIASQSSNAELAENAFVSLTERIEAALPQKAPAEVQIAHGLIVAELHKRFANLTIAGNSTETEAQRRSRRQAYASYASVYGRRAQLGEAPREALPFATPAGDWHPTARDVVSHLYARFLANEPEGALSGSAEISRLLGPLPKGLDAEESLAGKACAVLDDLERWHRHLSARIPAPAASALNRRAGALQARLARLNVLYRAFPSTRDRALIVANLRTVLPAYRDDAAWAEGMAQLALFVNETAERPEDPLALAEAVARAYPRSPGGVRAAAIARVLRFEIDDPELGFSVLPGSQPGGATISVSHRRAAKIRFEAYAAPPESVLEDRDWLEGAAGMQNPRPTEAPRGPATEWTASLPEPPRRSRSTASIPLPMRRKGLYRIRAAQGASPMSRDISSLLVSDMVLLVRRSEREVEVWAVEASSGAPIPGAEVRLLQRRYRPVALSVPGSPRQTDADGRVAFALPLVRTREGHHVIVARRGDDIASAYVEPYPRLRAEESPPNVHPQRPVVTLSLDRPSGNAGETVRWKARVHCAGGNSHSQFLPVSGVPLTVSLREGRASSAILATAHASSDAFGLATGRLVLPKSVESSRQGWRFELTADAACGAPRTPAVSVRVPLPQRPAKTGIEVVLPDVALVSGAPARLLGIVSRNGAPLPGARVAWEITVPARTVEPGDRRRAETGSFENQRDRISEGLVSTDRNGRFAIPVVGPAVPSKEPYALLQLNLRSRSGERALMHRSLKVSPAAVTLHVSGGTVYRSGEPLSMTITRRHLTDGTPWAGEVLVRVQRTNSLEEAATGIDLHEERLVCDGMGVGRFGISLGAGFYRLLVTAGDGTGGTVQVARALVVDGPGLRSPVPLTLLLDSGETGPRRIFAKGSGARVVVEITRAGAPVERLTIAPEAGGVVEVQAPSNQAVSVLAYAVRNGKLWAYERGFPGRDDRLVISLLAVSPSLEIRATSPDGAPLAGVALDVLAAPSGSQLYEGDPFGRYPAQPEAAPRPQLFSLAQPPYLRALPEWASEWSRVRVPAAPQEPDLLPFNLNTFVCGSMMDLIRPQLPRESGRGYSHGSAVAALDRRRDAPAVLWAPGLVTDSRGIASTPFRESPRTGYRLSAVAICKDGRTGFLSTSVLPR